MKKFMSNKAIVGIIGILAVLITVAITERRDYLWSLVLIMFIVDMIND